MKSEIQNKQGAEVAIDLGTYNSVCAVAWGTNTLLLRAREGQTDQGICFPSFVEFDDSGDPVRVGELARRSVNVRPELVVWGVKRMIGKSYQEVKQKGELDRFQYRVAEGRDGSCRIVVGKSRKEYSPGDIATLILKKIKADSESGANPLNSSITDATITVPAYFSPFQRAETEQAARRAGFKVIHLIPESTAAALAYQVKLPKQDQFIIVTDLGAGTFDVTVALAFLDSNGGLQTAEKGHGGNTALGGLDIDDALFKFVVSEFSLKSVLRDVHGRSRLRFELEKAKIVLSAQTETRVSFGLERGRVDFSLTRDKLESAVRGTVAKCLGPIDVAMKEAGVESRDIARVLLVGGPTQMPVYRQLLLDRFKDNPAVSAQLRGLDRDGSAVSPMEAVARGAVIGIFGGISPHAYGVVLDDAYHELIPRRTRYPCRNSIRQRLAGKKRSLILQLVQKELDPASLQEVYSLLGIFQFDYQPTDGGNDVQVEATYSENGVLDLRIVQPLSMIEMHLFDVGRLEGKPMARPRYPLPVGTPRYDPRPSAPSEDTAAASVALSGGRGSRMPAPETSPNSHWAEADLDKAVRFARAVQSAAQNRIPEASPSDAGHIRNLLISLSEWIGDTTAEPNRRTPQIRNISRSLLTSLVSSRLVTHDEAKALQQLNE